MSNTKSIGVSFDRTNAVPLDSQMYTDTMNNATAYAGQRIFDKKTKQSYVVIDTEGDSPSLATIVTASDAGNILVEGNSGAFGKNNKVEANGAFAFGENNTINSACHNSFVVGLNNEVTKNSQAVFGRYNSTNDNAIFQVGNGDEDTGRKSVFEIFYDGSIKSTGELLRTVEINFSNIAHSYEGLYIDIWYPTIENDWTFARLNYDPYNDSCDEDWFSDTGPHKLLHSAYYENIHTREYDGLYTVKIQVPIGAPIIIKPSRGDCFVRLNKIRGSMLIQGRYLEETTVETNHFISTTLQTDYNFDTADNDDIITPAPDELTDRDANLIILGNSTIKFDVIQQ